LDRDEANVSDHCPHLSAILAVAAGEISPEVTHHAETCERCAAMLREAQEEVAFERRVRDLASGGKGPNGTPTIPGYRSFAVVSAGGQGVVYRAVQESTQREVAIKMLVSGRGATMRQRLRAEREAEIVASLRHPNIVTVFESRMLWDGQIAVVMEFVDGVPLDRWNPPGATEAERLRSMLSGFAAICGAIHHAHLNGVIHRDLKPDNILVTREGRPVVLDFGIAKAAGLGTVGTNLATRTGEFAGTPAFASPEQASGQPDQVNALTDIYSLGVILYRLVCGVMPYPLSGTMADMAEVIRTVDPVSPREHDASISPDLAAIILRAIRKDKSRRYQSAADLSRDVERYLAGQPVEARSGSGWYLLRKAVSVNKRRLVWAGVAVLLAGGAVASVALSLSRAASSAQREDAQRTQARSEVVRARAVSTILREALPDADPGRAEVVTGAIRTGLSRLYLRIESGDFAEDPELDQALRRMWAETYTGLGAGKGLGMVEYSEISLRNGLVRLRQLHGDVDHAEIAAGLHNLAGVVLLRQRAAEAEVICRESMGMRRRLFGEFSFEVGESESLMARVLVQLGRNEEARTKASEALRALESHPPADADLPVATMRALIARLDMADGRLAEAEAGLDDALTRRLRRLAPDDGDLLALLRDAADLADRSKGTALIGRIANAWSLPESAVAAALRETAATLALPDRGNSVTPLFSGRTDAFGRVFRLVRVTLGEDSPALVRVLMARVQSADAENRVQEKCDALLDAAQLLEGRLGKNDPSALMCLDVASLTLAFNGRPGRAVELAMRTSLAREEVAPAARDAVIIASARRFLAWYLTLDERWSEALATYARAEAEIAAALGPRHHVMGLARGGMAYCYLELGDIAKADALSAEAMEITADNPAASRDQIGIVQFVRGVVLARLGRGHEAMPLFDSAWDKFLTFAPDEFTWRARVIQEARAIAAATGDAEASARWDSRAVVAAQTSTAP